MRQGHGKVKPITKTEALIKINVILLCVSIHLIETS
jgi:hypothetical protein